MLVVESALASQRAVSREAVSREAARLAVE